MEKHLLEAAERGDAAAQFNLGILYENGLSDSRYAAEGSRPEAVRWLLAAAEQSLPRAQIKLAAMYAGEPEMPDGAVRGQSVRVDILATASLRGAQSPTRPTRLPMGVHEFDSGRDRTGQVPSATLEAVAADRRALLGPQKSPEGASA